MLAFKAEGAGSDHTLAGVKSSPRCLDPISPCVYPLSDEYVNEVEAAEDGNFPCTQSRYGDHKSGLNWLSSWF